VDDVAAPCVASANMLAGSTLALSGGRGFLLFAIAAAYVLLAPYTKVEESFHLQAVHDVLVHGADVAAYDHLEFPGVVPRTFLGALVLAALSWPAKVGIAATGLPKVFVQVAVRLALAALLCHAYSRLMSAVSRRLGRRTARAMVYVVAATPHFLFYASRTLPNTFAVIMVTHAVAEWLWHDQALEDEAAAPPAANGDKRTPYSQRWSPSHLRWSVAWLVCAIVWLRCDMLVLLGPVGLSWLARRRATIPQLVFNGAVAGLVALAATVAVDSFFWRRWLWPEGVVLWFNTVQNRSHEYGVSAWHWYFTSALPRALLGMLPFILPATVTLRHAPSPSPLPSPSPPATTTSTPDVTPAPSSGVNGGDRARRGSGSSTGSRDREPSVALLHPSPALLAAAATSRMIDRKLSGGAGDGGVDGGIATRARRRSVLVPAPDSAVATGVDPRRGVDSAITERGAPPRPAARAISAPADPDFTAAPAAPRTTAPATAAGRPDSGAGRPAPDVDKYTGVADGEGEGEDDVAEVFHNIEDFFWTRYAPISSVSDLAKRVGIDWDIVEFLAPAVGFIALYSLLPHKELRFLMPGMPLLHIAAGCGLTKVYRFGEALWSGIHRVRPGPEVAAAELVADAVESAVTQRAPAAVAAFVSTPRAQLQRRHFGAFRSPPLTGSTAASPQVTPGGEPSPLVLDGPPVRATQSLGRMSMRDPRLAQLRDLAKAEGARAAAAAAAAAGGGGGGAAVGGRAGTSAADEPTGKPPALTIPPSPPTPDVRAPPEQTVVRGDGLTAADVAPRDPTALSLIRRALGALVVLLVAGLVGATAAGTVLFVRVSMSNYPGGSALQRLYTVYATEMHQLARHTATRGATLARQGFGHRRLPHDHADGRLLPCPEHDVTAVGWAEWWRQCIDSKSGCPPQAPWSPVFTPPPPAWMAAVCASPLGDSSGSNGRVLQPVTVHIDVASAESGVSRFGEPWSRAGWRISKDESLSPLHPQAYAAFDYLLTENATAHATLFDVVDHIPAFKRVTLRPLSWGSASQPRSGLGWLSWLSRRLGIAVPVVEEEIRLYIMLRKATGGGGGAVGGGGDVDDTNFGAVWVEG